MSVPGHGGALTIAPEEQTNPTPEQTANLPSLRPDVVLPHSVLSIPEQPKGDDATAAFPAAPDACSNSSSSVRSNISTVSCHRDSSSSNSLHSPFSGAPDATDTNIANHSNMVATEMLLAADPAAGAAERPLRKLSRLMGRVLPFSGSSSKSHQQLLLPCLLGDPFVCISVDRRVGVSAGTLLGRLSVFYWPTPPTVQEHQQEDVGIKGQVLLPQAYSDDGVAISWIDTSHITAIMGASDLVQWRIPSLRCMGSEQLSLFAGRSAFSSVTISMRLLRRQQDTQQLLLLYRHCSKELAEIVFHKVKNPQPEALSSPSLISEGRQQRQRAWAGALASGLCTLDPQQQQQQREMPKYHSTCLIGTGAACIMDSREGDMYERYETSYFCKLWRSVEACNLIALDFNGDFVLCCSGDGSMDRRWLYVVDARGASRQVEESQGWCAARRSYMDEFLVYKRWRTAVDVAYAAFACCGGTCTHYKGAEQQQQQRQSASASSSGSRLLRRQGAPAVPAEEGSKEEDKANPNTAGERETDVPLRCLPALFLRCLQKGPVEHEKLHTQINRKNTSVMRRLMSSLSSGGPEPSQPTAATTAGLRGSRTSRRGFVTAEQEMLHVLRTGEGDTGGKEPNGSRQKYHQDISLAYEGDCHAFFLFEKTPLAFRVCDAFFRFCSLMLQHQRQQQQRTNVCGDEMPPDRLLRAPPPCKRKPLRYYRQRARVLHLDSLRMDFCFLSLDANGWLQAFSLFRSTPLQSIRVDKNLFAAGWPYFVASDGPVVAYTSDKGVYGLLLNEANLGCSWVAGTEAFCLLPSDPDIQRAASAQGR